MRRFDDTLPRLVRLGAIAVLLLAPAASAEKIEERCRELGASCSCAESLDWNAGSGFLPDPTDPADSDSMECAAGKTIYQSGDNASTQRLSSSSAAAMPAGNTVEFILADQCAGQLNVRGTRNTQLSDSTYCGRMYLNFSSDFPAPIARDSRKKQMRFKGQNDSASPGVELEWRPGSSNPELTFNPSGSYWWTDPTQSQVRASIGEPDIRYNDCRGSWCRLEYCMDHNASGLPGDHLNFRGRLVKLTSGEVRNFGPKLSTRAQPHVDTGYNTWLVDGYCQNISGGQQYYSHAMQAIVSPADPNFWIGPAAEVEGATSGGTPPPPPPPPATLPAAPVLLP